MKRKKQKTMAVKSMGTVDNIYKSVCINPEENWFIEDFDAYAYEYE